MKYLLMFFLICKLAFSIPVEELSWKMTKQEVQEVYPGMIKASFNNNEEVFKVDEIIRSDTVNLTFLFYRDELIQIQVSNKYPRQSRSFSKNFLEKISEKYTFTDIKTKYTKSGESIKQIKEYIGISEDGKTHLLLKIDVTDNTHKNTFIFSDSEFLED